MEITSVNIGQEKTIWKGDTPAQTGIYKLPVKSPVEITPEGLAGDTIRDTKNHGGVDQAIYIYGVLDYEWWAALLGRALSPGTFGENLTLSELESARLSIGDRLEFDSIILEVTAPRIPCATLAARMGDPAFVKRFRAAERPGVYCRVIQGGWVQRGLSVRYIRYPGPTVTVLEMYRDFYERDSDEHTLRRFLAAPIDIRSRQHKEKQLAALQGT